MESLAGKLLVASAQLLDPNFARTVLILVQHNDEGAMGLILNRPLETSVKEACEQAVNGNCQAEGVLYQGGPCKGPLMVMHRHEAMHNVQVLPGIFFTTERSKIEWLMQNEPAGHRYFVGYAGWSPGQLESEMKVGSWLTADPTDKQIFNVEDDLWQNAIMQITLGKWIDPSKRPEDPSMN